MNKSFDIMVAGLGAHGSSAIYQLSKTGYTVCGIDRFTPPHNHGSSHGQSRIIRQAYHESPMYVPLVKAAYGLWNEIEEISGKQLLLKTGGIVLGDENAAVVKGAKLSAEAHHLAYDYLNSDDIKRLFPAFKPANDTVAVVEKDAGILFPEKCIAAYLEAAHNNGAGLLYGETITAIVQTGDTIKVTTDKNSYTTAKLIVSAGAWLTQLLPELALPLVVERQVLYWFKNKNAAMQPGLLPGKLPVYIWEYKQHKIFYGFPDLGDGIKIAYHHAGEKISPAALRTQVVTKEETEDIRKTVAAYLMIEPEFNYSDVCMYTNTPDEHFIIDYYPLNKNIIIASPCSGHGFKFASLVGKIAAGMATGSPLQFDISAFNISRFKKADEA